MRKFNSYAPSPGMSVTVYFPYTAELSSVHGLNPSISYIVPFLSCEGSGGCLCRGKRSSIGAGYLLEDFSSQEVLTRMFLRRTWSELLWTLARVIPARDLLASILKDGGGARCRPAADKENVEVNVRGCASPSGSFRAQ